MRKPRNYDDDLKVLAEKARALQTRKVQQLGALVVATGADRLASEELAGALLAAVESANAAAKEGWRAKGAAFFQRSRGSRRAVEHGKGGAPRQSDAPPTSGEAGA